MRVTQTFFNLPTYMSLAKNLGGRVGFEEIFRAGGAKIVLKMLLQICENLERF